MVSFPNINHWIVVYVQIRSEKANKYQFHRRTQEMIQLGWILFKHPVTRISILSFKKLLKFSCTTPRTPQYYVFVYFASQ